MSTLSTIFFICLHISIVPNIPTNTRIDKEIITIILKLFQFEGPISFSRLDGMFAICIYDKLSNKVYLARDYFGEKPLYFLNSKKEGFTGCKY